MANDSAIDWQDVRRRIAERAMVQAVAPVPPVATKVRKRKKLAKGTPEYEEYCKRERERARKYRAMHKEQTAAAFKRWCEKNPEKHKAKCHRYYMEHKAEIIEKKRQRRLADPEKARRLKHESYLRRKARRLAAAA